MPVAVEHTDYSAINQQNFGLLVSSINTYGYDLSPIDVDELRAFFSQGAEKLKLRAAEENYEDELSYATGQLINQFAFSTPAAMASFKTFRDFLRSFCPLDPFC